MQVTAGTRLKSAVSSTEVVVVRPPDGEVVLTCGGVPMVDLADASQSPHAPELDGKSLLGKRYTDEASGVELLCTKGGNGQLECDGRPLAIKAAKPLPSSD
jgi:hypothetical protein